MQKLGNKIFLIGISGIGMSALAKILHKKGYLVSGSDLKYSQASEDLVKMGINVIIGHKSENVEGVDTVFYSTAIKETNPEYKKAKELGIPLLKRGELLKFISNEYQTLSVAGTHGKTTTSSMLGATLLPVDPTIIVGGIVPEIGSNSKIGESDILVVEADESDNSFLYLKTHTGIITNVEPDHLELHGSFENIKESFKTFIGKIEKTLLYYNGCEVLKKLVKESSNDIQYLSYGLEENGDTSADIIAKNIRVKNQKTTYEVEVEGKKLGEFILTIPGKHNVLNSLPVIYIALKNGVEINSIKKAIEGFKGAKRRYEVLFDQKELRIIDDYAHHPTEIKATLEGASKFENGRRIIAIFQPHRYSRLKFLLDEFAGVFTGASEVVLTDIYSAGEENIYNIGLEDLLEVINHNTAKIKSLKELENFDYKKEVASDRETTKGMIKDTTIIFMGAGDISALAHKVAEKYLTAKK